MKLRQSYCFHTQLHISTNARGYKLKLPNAAVLLERFLVRDHKETIMSFGRLNFRVQRPKADEGADKEEAPLAKRQRKTGGKHQMAACCACKRKRKKCDGKYPICSGCLNSGLECTIFDLTTSRTIPRNYIQQLEEKIALLDKELDVLRDITKCQTDSNNTPTKEAPQEERKQNLESDIGFITLGAASESHFIGQSSAFSIARAITDSINYYNKGGAPDHKKTAHNPREMVHHSFTSPSIHQAHDYLNFYESSVQCQYPFLDWYLVSQWFYDVQVNNSQDPKKLFFIYMIFAIGSQIQSASSKTEYGTSNILTRSYYNKAFEHINDLLKNSTLETVQVYLLLSVFSQNMPDGTSIWQTTGLAIRTAVTLGLHRKPYKSTSVDNVELDNNPHLSIRSRVFWSAYSLERINALVLGRPFGISDIDIDAPIPSNDPDIPVACHVFKLRRIQSSICTFVYKPVPLMDPPDEIDSTRVSIVLELNDWMNTFPAKEYPVSRFETYNWCSISYHNSMLLLLRPVVLEVSKSKTDTSPRLIEWFKAFTHSASAICMNYKDLHAKGKLNATWLSMHCLFVSGISFLYCLWIDNQIKVLEWKGQRVIYDTISSCSSILYVLAERWHSAAVFRDTFEQLSSAVLLKLEEPIDRRSFAGVSESPYNISASSKSTKGALDYHTIGIDQYLSYESQPWKTDSDKEGSVSCVSSEHEHEGIAVGNVPQKLQPEATMSFLNNFDLSLWEFLDTTGDKFLRDIYQDMESNLGKI